MSVLTDMKNRGVTDTFFLVCDGLKGLPGRGRVKCVADDDGANMHHPSDQEYLQWGLHLAAVTLENAQVSWSRQGRPDSSRSRLGGSIRSRTGGSGGGRVRPALRSSL